MGLDRELRHLQSELSRRRAQRRRELVGAVNRAEKRVAALNRELLAAATGPAGEAERARAAAAVAQAQAAVDRSAAALAAGKALASRRKDQIAEWKAWFAALPVAEQPLQTGALAQEIDWRAAELDRLTVEIAMGSGELLQLQGELALARAAQASAEHGLPARDDPRVAELYTQLDDARAALEPALAALHAAETAETAETTEVTA
jgi:hypothetical protein